MNIQIRWLIRRDMSAVLNIEYASFPNPWTDDDFISCLKQRHCIGMIAEVDFKVVGYMVYELHKNRLHVLNFAVDPKCRRMGVGRAMVERLVDKLSQQRRNEIALVLRESNLSAQQFFRACGFKAVSVDRGVYEDTDEDGYQFRFLKAEEVSEVRP